MTEKLRIGLVILGFLLLAIFAFSFSRSLALFRGGVEVVLPEPGDSPEKLQDILNVPDLSLGKIYWKTHFLYPVGLLTEAGGLGPEGVISHARNLILVNLKTGSTKQLFSRDIYIWDYFVGEFIKEVAPNQFDAPKEETLNLDKKLVIIASLDDSNKDGVLNQKDRRRIYLYDPDKEDLIDILPLGNFYKSIVFNAGKGQLVVVAEEDQIEEETTTNSRKKKDPLLFVYSFDTATGKGVRSLPVGGWNKN